MRLFSAADNRWPRARPPRRPNALAISDAFMRTFYLALSIQTRQAPHPSVFFAVLVVDIANGPWYTALLFCARALIAGGGPVCCLLARWVMRLVQRFVLLLFASALLMSASPLEAQVTTATLVGQLHDTSGAVIPGATVVATHEGTGVSREAVTDANGEFVLAALPSGEARSLATYGGENQCPGMSLDSMWEVQIVKGVLPAECGGVAGGPANVITRSGTNHIPGPAVDSGQNEKFNARNFFPSA